MQLHMVEQGREDVVIHKGGDDGHIALLRAVRRLGKHPTAATLAALNQALLLQHGQRLADGLTADLMGFHQGHLRGQELVLPIDPHLNGGAQLGGQIPVFDAHSPPPSFDMQYLRSLKNLTLFRVQQRCCIPSSGVLLQSIASFPVCGNGKRGRKSEKNRQGSGKFG